MKTKYEIEYQESIEQPEAFGSRQSQLVDWIQKPQKVISKDSNDHYRWFEGGLLNTSALALDRHVAQGRGDQTAIIYDSPVTQTKQSITYIELKDQVALLAGALQRQGLTR